MRNPTITKIRIHSAESQYHEENAHECKTKGYEGSYIYHCEMSDMYNERAEFYRRYPTRAGRRSARKENIRVGRYY